MGAQVRDGGINVAVFSQHAEKIELCVFDAGGQCELKRFLLNGPDDGVFSGFLPGEGAGLVYGFRAYGPYLPEAGHRFNPNKLLLDPYAREIVGRFTWRAEHHGYVIGHADGTRTFDERDNGVHALKSRVAAPGKTSIARRNAPRHPLKNVILYEVHVKGFSMLHPEIPEAIRGTFSALSHPASIAHFKNMGVTTLSLLPVQTCLDEPSLAGRGTNNYWGYNTLGFFSPDPRLSAADDPTAVAEEFRQMVATLHAHGFEVVMDVVYNHTPEGNEFGPTLSFRGLDNASWYRHEAGDRSRAANLTGCGNTLNVEHPRVAQFILDSLRFWVDEMGVDGFRFDLAAVLGRECRGFDPRAAFFVALRQDPILADVHLIAEPWDAGENGYQLGQFPGRFIEWNDKFRDAVRGYWLTNGVTRGEFARRFSASSDLFHHAQKKPTASVNFVTAHDGFTLADVVGYSKKHNHANGEENRDGRDNELCANFGIEGPTLDTSINALRERVRRAMAATLLLAQGTPMFCAGDEIGNSQQGNNNSYCQDNPTGWIDWANADEGFSRFICKVILLRCQTPLLRHDDWFESQRTGESRASLTWHAPQGRELQLHDWRDDKSHAFGCRLIGATAAANIPDERLIICFNPERQPTVFTLPTNDWQIVLDTSDELPQDAGYLCFDSVTVPPQSLVVLRPADFLIVNK